MKNKNNLDVQIPEDFHQKVHSKIQYLDRRRKVKKQYILSLSAFLLVGLMAFSTTTQAQMLIKSVEAYFRHEDIIEVAKEKGYVQESIQVVKGDYTVHFRDINNDSKRLSFQFMIEDKDGNYMTDYTWYITSIFAKGYGNWGGNATENPWKRASVYLNEKKVKGFKEMSIEFDIYLKDGRFSLTHVKVPYNPEMLDKIKTINVNKNIKVEGGSQEVLVKKIEITPLALYATVNMSDKTVEWYHSKSFIDDKDGIQHGPTTIDYDRFNNLTLEYPYTEYPHIDKEKIKLFFITSEVVPIELAENENYTGKQFKMNGIDYTIKDIEEDDYWIHVRLESDSDIRDNQLWSLVGRRKGGEWKTRRDDHMIDLTDGPSFIGLTRAEIEIETGVTIEELVKLDKKIALSKLQRYIDKYDHLREIDFNKYNIRSTLETIRLRGAISFMDNESFKNWKERRSDLSSYKKATVGELDGFELGIMQRGKEHLAILNLKELIEK